MPTEPVILACWKVLDDAGLKRPWASKRAADDGLKVWAAVLADVADERLPALTVAYLRSERGRFWPMPGELLHALGEDTAIDDADDAWAEVLQMLRLLGRDQCPTTPAELENFRSKLRAGYALARERGNHDSMDRIRRKAAVLPREDAERNEAIFAGVQACGGWRGLGLVDENDTAAHRASFRAAYRGRRQRRALSENEARVAALIGDTALRMLPGGRDDHR